MTGSHVQPLGPPAAYDQRPYSLASSDPTAGTTVDHIDRQAIARWLLGAVQSEQQEQARIQWTEAGGIALLPCGGLFSAVRAPAHLVWAAAGTEELPVVDAFLRQWFDGGAAFADLHALLYYFLVPSSTAWKWTDRHLPGVEYLGRDHYLGVPAVHLTEPQGRGYWCLPMDSAGDLCYPDEVEKLLHHGRATRSGVNAQ